MAMDAPGPEECVAEPIPLDEFNALVDTAPATPAPAASSTLPAGPVADEETSAAVQATVRQLAACLNANDTLRELSLYTDRYVLQQLAGSRGQDLTETAYAEEERATPVAEADRTSIVIVGDVVQLEDARAAASVQFSDDGSKAIVYLANEDGTWKIDDLVAVDDLATPAS